MFLDVFGICDNNADEKKMFLILFGSEFKLNSPNIVVRSLRRTFTFCACRRCHFNSTEQLKQEKTKLCKVVR